MEESEKNHLKDPVLRLGISTCLLGEQVRFDGGHKLDRYLTGTLGLFCGVGAGLSRGGAGLADPAREPPAGGRGG